MFNNLIACRRHALLLALFAAVVLTGCTSQYTGNVYRQTMQDLRLHDDHAVVRQADWVLPAATRFHLMRPVGAESQLDTARLHHLYNHSDQLLGAHQSLMPRINAALHTAIQQEVLARFGVVTTADASTLNEALYHARAFQAQVLLVPSVVIKSRQRDTLDEMVADGVPWDAEDGATDRTMIRIAAYDVTSGRLLDMAVVASRSRLLAGDDYHINQLMRGAARAYAMTISSSQPDRFQ